MTGPDDDGPSGVFDHLDDAAPPTPSREVLSSVVHRGRRIRARRQGAIALTGAAAVSAAVIAGLGLSHAVDADRSRDRIFPANSATPSASSPASHHRSPGVSIIAPQGPATSPPLASASEPCPSESPSTTPTGTASPSPQPSATGQPSAQATGGTAAATSVLPS